MFIIFHCFRFVYLFICFGFIYLSTYLLRGGYSSCLYHHFADNWFTSKYFFNYSSDLTFVVHPKKCAMYAPVWVREFLWPASLMIIAVPPGIQGFKDLLVPVIEVNCVLSVQKHDRCRWHEDNFTFPSGFEVMIKRYSCIDHLLRLYPVRTASSSLWVAP